jgi:hypothetical protein
MVNHSTRLEGSTWLVAFRAYCVEHHTTSIAHSGMMSTENREDYQYQCQVTENH